MSMLLRDLILGTLMVERAVLLNREIDPVLDWRTSSERVVKRSG
jgi:hypothetical protein